MSYVSRSNLSDTPMKNCYIWDPVLTWGSVYLSHTRLKNIRALQDWQSFKKKIIMLVMKGAILLLTPPGEKSQAATANEASSHPIENPFSL